MPSYKITDSQTGKSFKVSGTSPPTEDEAAQIFADYYKANGGDTPTNDPADYPQGVTSSDAEKMRKEFLKKEGTLKTRIQNTPKQEIIDNIKYELPRIAQEAVTVPLNTAVKAGYGLAALPVAAVKGTQAATDMINSRPQISGPMESSMVGEAIGAGVEANNRLADETGTGWVKPIMEAGMDTLAVVGTAKSLPVAKAALSATGKAALRAAGNVVTPESLYGSAVKLPNSKAWRKTMNPEEVTKRQDAINAGLANEILPNELGLAQSKQLLTDAAAKTAETITEMDSMGRVIPKSTLRKGLANAQGIADVEGTSMAQKVVDSMYEPRFNKKGEMRPAGATQDIFGNEVSTLERFYSPSEMQSIKKQLQSMSDYERTQLARGLGSQIRELANKDMAHEAMVALEHLNPELKALNRNTQAYISLVEGIEQAAGRIQNLNPVSLGSKVLASANIGLAILDQVLGLPSIKAKIAFTLNKARKQPAAIRKGNLREQITPQQPPPLIPTGANMADPQRVPIGLQQPVVVGNTTQRVPIGLQQEAGNLLDPLGIRNAQ